MPPTEKQKMLSGALYDPRDPQLAAERRRARLLVHGFNQSRDDQPELRDQLLRQLFGAAGSSLTIEPPFHCDYGSNITLGDGVFFNFNCVVLDVAPVTIGSRVLVGPAVQIYAATHPLQAAQRRTMLEAGAPVWIDDDVWLGGGVIVCPGVRIGAGSVIAAGSVVTRDVPAGVVAAGNPCRVLRPIDGPADPASNAPHG